MCQLWWWFRAYILCKTLETHQLIFERPLRVYASCHGSGSWMRKWACILIINSKRIHKPTYSRYQKPFTWAWCVVLNYILEFCHCGFTFKLYYYVISWCMSYINVHYADMGVILCWNMGFNAIKNVDHMFCCIKCCRNEWKL